MSEIKQPIGIEASAILALKQCRFDPASKDKSFVESVDGALLLSESERGRIWRLFIKYRRQIKGMTITAGGVSVKMEKENWREFYNFALTHAGSADK